MSTDGTDEDLTYDYEVTHLTCFLGGMFGLGGKIFDSAEDVEIGKKLTDGCVWAYEAMPAGVMAEYSSILPCKSVNECKFNETAWYEKLDPQHSWREENMAEWEERHAAWEKEVEEIKAAKKAAEEKKTSTQQGDEKKADSSDAEKSSSGKPTENEMRTEDSEAIVFKRGIVGDEDASKINFNDPSGQTSSSNSTPDDQISLADEYELPAEPIKPKTHEEYVKDRLESEKIPKGFVNLNDKRYILRPEAIESVWYMYRITGDPIWQEKGWKMWKAIIAATSTPIGHSAIQDVTSDDITFTDNMESFWLAETLKYFYLLYAEPDLISLDDWVLNTEAHPFKRPT
jgi:mannosyl-oligosaccharide alpha-1,2-mannosidase